VPKHTANITYLAQIL